LLQRLRGRAVASLVRLRRREDQGGQIALRFISFALIVLALFLFVVISEGAAQNPGKTHSFHFQNTELRAVLDSLLRWYAVPLIYLERDISGKRVDAECGDCTFQEALRVVIKGKGLVWKMLGDQALLQREPETREPKLSSATFAGTIKDSLTGEAIVGAGVFLLIPPLEQEDRDGLSRKIYRWCTTNQSGFFSLRNIQPGDYLLEVRRPGYRTRNASLIIPPGSAIVRDVTVLEETMEYPEITVEGRRSAFSTAEGLSHGVYIRAAPTDHNQYFLEGARIYNPLHFGGVMSTFNGDALRDLHVIAGGVPPYYGGRIGGILDVMLRDGTERGLAGSAAVGSLGSSLVLEGPMWKAATFVISGRKGYPDVLFPRYRTEKTPSDLNSSELMVKLSHRFSQVQQLSLSTYFGRDTYDNHIANQRGDQLSNFLRWGNAALNVRWLGVISSSLFSSASAIYTRYGFNVEHRLEGRDGRAQERFASDYFIEDVAVRAHAEYFYDEYHTVLAGVELARHWFGGRISEFSSQIAPMLLEGFSPWELSVYLQDQWRLTPSVMAEVGARATSFIARQGSFSAVDPRFSLLVLLRNDLRLYSSLCAVNQFVHPYRHSGLFLFYPSIFLYPSTDQMRPSTSLQVSLGVEKSFHHDRYRLALESHYRRTQNLHEFLYDTTMASQPAGRERTLSDALLLGEGNVYGAELTVDKRSGNVGGSLRYGISWSSNRFAELNGGQPFRPRFDRRHELYATLFYAPHENWALGMSCLLSSNRFPSFAPTGLKAERVTPAAEVRMGLDAARYAEPYDLNGGRLPGFQRLEFRVQHKYSWWGLPFQATLRLLNGYGLIDPFVWELRENPDNRLKWRARFDAPPLFPLYPVVSVSARF